MTIKDERLRKHYEHTTSLVADYPTDEIPILALLDAWQWFHLTEGDDSPSASEALEHLLSAELRPGLRRWYKRGGSNMNAAAIEFRDRLSGLAGEKLG